MRPASEVRHSGVRCTTRRTLIGAVVACGMLTACSADKVDYKTAAEKVARETVEGLIPGDATADCGDPTSTDVGTTFGCTGTASDLTVYTFKAEITKAKEVTVTLLDTGTPAAGATGATSADTGGTSATLPSEDTVAEAVAETVAETTTAITAPGTTAITAAGTTAITAPGTTAITAPGTTATSAAG